MNLSGDELQHLRKLVLQVHARRPQNHDEGWAGAREPLPCGATVEEGYEQLAGAIVRMWTCNAGAHLLQNHWCVVVQRVLAPNRRGCAALAFSMAATAMQLCAVTSAGVQAPCLWQASDWLAM